MLKVTNLSRTFASGGVQVKAVDDISFEVKDGVFASIIGKSGSGKSTLLALLGALDKPTGGTIEVGGKDLTKVRFGKLNEYRRDMIGFVFQNYHLVPNLTALENVMLPMRKLGQLSEQQAKQKASQLLENLGMQEHQHKLPSQLSGGQRRPAVVVHRKAGWACRFCFI
jgi:putative ABC transport system ATP-binding protein